jgi:hypothetical protein
MEPMEFTLDSLGILGDLLLELEPPSVSYLRSPRRFTGPLVPLRTLHGQGSTCPLASYRSSPLRSPIAQLLRVDHHVP